MDNKIFLANYCQFIKTQNTAQSQQAGMAAGAQVGGGGAGAAVAHHGAASLAAPVPVGAIGVAGSFSEGGQTFCPAKIRSFPANIFSSSPFLFCQVFLLRYSAKLFCQMANMVGELLQNS